MRQLSPRYIDAVNLLDVYSPQPVVEGRPGVRINMIASADGAVSLNGRAGGLGGTVDRELFALLRSLADVILVGAGTMRVESYGPAPLSQALVDARLSRGQTSHPPIAVVTRSCDLDWSSPLFTDPHRRPIVLTARSAPLSHREAAAAVSDLVLCGDDHVDLNVAIDALGERGFGAVLGEGGPTLNGGLAASGLIDEICLTLSPLLLSGAAGRIVNGPILDVPVPLEVSSVCQDGDILFLRLTRGGSRSSPPHQQAR